MAKEEAELSAFEELAEIFPNRNDSEKDEDTPELETTLHQHKLVMKADPRTHICDICRRHGDGVYVCSFPFYL